jgi:hypothetical protein
MYKYIYKLKEELSMGMDRLEKAIEDLEQRIELLEEIITLVVYRNDERCWNGPDLEHKEGDQ